MNGWKSPELHELLVRNPLIVEHARFRIVAVDGEEPILAFRANDRLEENGVGDCEDTGDRTNPERQRYDDGCRKGRRARQPTSGLMQPSPQPFDQRLSDAFAKSLTSRHQAPELRRRRVESLRAAYHRVGLEGALSIGFQ